MINIRNNTFETNSSSVHAMVVANEPWKADTEVTAFIGEYGWGRELLDTPDEKISYLYTAACDIHCRDMQKELRDILTCYGVRFSIGRYPVFQKYGSEQYLSNGHVDHCDEAAEFVAAMLSYGDLLMRYLFCPGSFVVISNDGDDTGWYEEKINVDYPHTLFEKGN